jgi:uncharacterized protein YdeI (YjbR/CyaY-like superfamily)
MISPIELPIISFKDIQELHLWLKTNSTTSCGVRVRLYKTKSKIPSVTFQELLEEGLCFGWSESKRHPYDEISYLQFFTPRKTKGSTSTRNKLLIEKLIETKRMTDQGFAQLDKIPSAK